jgi:N-acetyl-beta-hexosaminidase
MLPAGPSAPAWATNAEGYHLSVNTNGLLIQAATAQGAFYGLQTLAQLRTTVAGRPNCPAVEVADWPSLRFRGVHWFPSAAGVAMDERLINNVFSTYKFNTCVIQCEAARWDSHPEIAMRRGIAKADLRKLVADCRSRFLEPIPLVDVPGHADWMFRHGQHTNLIEDLQTPYACCVRNPQTIQFIEDVMAECLEVFHPQTFHLGFDEITLRGRFPNPDCPYCHDATATTLMAESAGQLAGWLAARGVATMIWGDMLLAPGEAADATNARTVAEARERRAAIAKNITIADWHYVWNADRTSLDILQQAGFHTIASTWEEPVNIYRFSQAAVASGSEGLLQTTWAGFFPDERDLQREIDQYAAYIIAADYAWSGRADPPARLGYEARAVFLKAYAAKFPPADWN